MTYLEETVYHVVLAGLRDTTLQEVCTTPALLGNIKDISSLVEFCPTKESGQMTASGNPHPEQVHLANNLDENISEVDQHVATPP